MFLPTRRSALSLATAALAASLLAACASAPKPRAEVTPVGLSGQASPALRAEIEAAVADAMKAYHLRALIVRVTEDGQDVYTAAFGESLTGVPATPNMHFRNGAFAFTYIGTIYAKLADAKRVSLDDKVAKWLPDLPRARDVSLRQLLNMTSGYADYVYQPAVLQGSMLEPHRQWTTDELIRIGVSAPMHFEPGTNWGYSHTNYVILAKVLEQITEGTVDEAMQAFIFKPMQLTATSNNGNTPAVPYPALHSYTSERRTYLKVPAELPFYEDATYWNPSWTTATGAVQTTNIYDATRSMEIIGSGAQVSPEMREEQLAPKLIGFGRQDPSGKCLPCRPMTNELSYGLGVILMGPWITQTKNFAGSGLSSGYLPSRKLTITTTTTYLPSAFDADGDHKDAASAVFNALANVVAPGQAPRARPGQ